MFNFSVVHPTVAQHEETALSNESDTDHSSCTGRYECV